MKARLALLLLVVIALAAGSTARAGQLTAEEQRGLRDRIQARYDVIPLTGGVALRPKVHVADVRLIEVTDTIAINGTVVTGRELRDRVGEDADAILRLSYLRADDQRALFETPQPSLEAPREPELEPAAPEPVEPSDHPRRRTWHRHVGSRDRVRVFGDVNVQGDEQIRGQVVAIFGSVRVDGEVSQDVVSVFGPIHLGPTSIVRGDVVAVGGAIHRAQGAQTHGSVTQISMNAISLGDADFHMNMPRLFRGWSGPVFWFTGHPGGLPRLIGTIVRLGLILLVSGIALLVARAAVEGAAQRIAESPVRSTLVGLTAQLLLIPVLLVTALLLVITVIGIPLLALLPFFVLLLVLLAVVGFTGAASAIGGGLLRRFGFAAAAPFVEVALGVLVLLSPLLLGRLLALYSWTTLPPWAELARPFALLLISAGFIVELLAWSGGFGAALTNTVTRWRARRAVRRNGGAAPAAPA